MAAQAALAACLRLAEQRDQALAVCFRDLSRRRQAEDPRRLALFLLADRRQACLRPDHFF